MKKLLIAASALGALALTATPAAAQRYGRSHTSISIGIGGYGPSYGGYYAPSYGYAPAYGYSPYGYGYDPYADSGYYAYEVRPGYDRYYDRSNYYDRRHRHHHRDRDRDRWDGYRR